MQRICVKKNSSVFIAVISVWKNITNLQCTYLGYLHAQQIRSRWMRWLLSATVLFCSPCTGDSVAKHYNNLQALLQQVGKLEVEEQNIVAEDYKVIYSVTSIYVDYWPYTERL